MKGALYLAFASSLFACSPAYAWQDYQLKRIIRNVHKVESFEGTVIETGIVPDGQSVKTDVLFSRPNRFAARVAEPADWAGSTVTYDGKTLLYHYPQLRYAIRFRGLTLPEGKDADQLIEYQYRQDIAHYDYHLSGSTKIADLPTITLWHNAKAAQSWNRRGWTKVYDKYSFPLAGESKFDGGADYGYRYDRIMFNTTIDPSSFTQALPEGTLIAEWDLDAPAWEEERARKEASFPIEFPDQNKLGLARKKIVRAAGPIPAYCARYERTGSGHFVLVTMFASRGISVPEYGVPIGEGRLIVSPALSSFTFVRDDVYYTLLGNVPYEELLTLAKEMDKPRT